MDGYLTIADYIKGEAKAIEEELKRSFDRMEMPPILKESMLYSLMAGGKRLRPILVLAAAAALNGKKDAALPAACAVEMVHTYSLIHDDLPALDNDDYRRGKLTNHKVFGEAMAIMAGDGLLTHAFALIPKMFSRFGVPAEQCLAIVADLALLAGPSGMVGGQVADLQGEQGQTTGEELDYIHTHKTGDMIVFSLKAGARSAGAGDEHLLALEKFGYAIGLAFQIQDDILDLTGDEDKLGKPLGSDEKMMKVTYPYLYGIEASQKKVEELTQTAKQAILAAGFPFPDKLLALADYLMKRDH
ncbi:polyprenyl synthetase family protein [Gorillibacterium massiliense]|uniref:polyprenyl synthetase family protein n=1 Tax=Gorillibacterium massiliense TaxID=1280390 RepID=UPI0004BB1A48|nr:farnesyl diphosphate synthase [Gorillibacterium massiliense]